MRGVKYIPVVVGALATLHAALSLAPLQFEQAPLCLAWLAYHSWFSVAALLQHLGIPTIGRFQEGMFMAPITPLGQACIVIFWLGVHTIAAWLIVWARQPRDRHETEQA
ncbi:MAG: hypothetical protein C0487_06490 [Leptothrix sp. (in: Bacteria)]|nr:hypothetical protein [Leptothrix sp. (in: b-proteobacteria)]HRH17880.1 hypothetical protein [Aquabacterium sp.]HRH28003.1 hypothetical protein [Aquabacterium sp.]